MKKFITFLILAGLLVLTACELKEPTQPELTTVTRNQLVLNKVVFIGNSLTAGFQSAGLVEDFQMHSYPYFIARQMGRAESFEQPLIADPGISSTPGVGVLDFINGEITPRGTYTDPVPLLKNAQLSRPYDNLGVPGADLNDVLNTTDGSGGNPFFDLILRNPTFGNMTQVEQAKALNPTLVVVWIGNNDVLGAALAGGDTSLITSVSDFQTKFTRLLTSLGEIRDGNVGIITANIPNVTDIPYVNLLDGLIYKTIPALGINVQVPVVFDADFQPVLFDSALGLYLPLLTEEGILGGTIDSVQHVLLPFLSAYQDNGLGIPDSAVIANTLISVGIDPAQAAVQAQALEQGMIAAGLNPSGNPIPGSLTITKSEEADLTDAVDGFNAVIAGIAGGAGIPVVDMKEALAVLNATGLDGYTGKFILFDPQNTAFSLDGVHPNNGGYAIIANKFIEVMNQFPDIEIPKVNTDQYRGQYLGKPVGKISRQAAEQAKAIFVR